VLRVASRFGVNVAGALPFEESGTFGDGRGAIGAASFGRAEQHEHNALSCLPGARQS